MFIVAFYNETNGIFTSSNPTEGMIFVRQIEGFAVLLAWGVGWSLILFLTLNHFKILRESLRTEVIGYDYVDYAKGFVLRPGAALTKKAPNKLSRFFMNQRN